MRKKKKKTAVWFYPEIDEIDDVDAKQYHRASFSTRNFALNTSLRKPIRMQDFIQLCDSMYSMYYWSAKTGKPLEHTIAKMLRVNYMLTFLS